MDEALLTYIKPELLFIAVALYFLGITLKNSKLKDNYIPIVLGGVGIVLAVLYIGIFFGWSLNGVISGVVQGLLCSAVSVYGNQIVKQMLKLKGYDDTVADVIADTIAPEEDK